MTGKRSRDFKLWLAWYPAPMSTRMARRDLGRGGLFQSGISIFRFFGPLLGLMLTACGAGEYCEGDDCNCNGRDECIISCGNGCDAQCANTGRACGVVCGNHCDFECSSTNHCTSFSGDRSVIKCHDGTSCAAECGADCDYEAYSIGSAAVTVGPGSTVYCHDMGGNCSVTCTGSCEVTCERLGQCEVDCERGGSRSFGEDRTVYCD